MDGRDRKILALLERDARLSYADIGASVGLAASSVHDRVRKLERSGVVRGYRAEIDMEKAGYPITAIVSLHQVDLACRFADHIIGLAQGRIVFDGAPDQLIAQVDHG